ncbi:hypothetical protein IPH25_00580 [bacterium]|nr:MAG: hypothetical protein IPG37_02700 [bacterium]QQR61929.1 MAG: hypothetical protein IPH25_00580 [bacterium]QQR62480.1 MAG: hypothetical protein IPH67_03600 [bacterium]
MKKLILICCIFIYGNTICEPAKQKTDLIEEVTSMIDGTIPLSFDRLQYIFGTLSLEDQIWFNITTEHYFASTPHTESQKVRYLLAKELSTINTIPSIIPPRALAKALHEVKDTVERRKFIHFFEHRKKRADDSYWDEVAFNFTDEPDTQVVLCDAAKRARDSVIPKSNVKTTYHPLENYPFSNSIISSIVGGCCIVWFCVKCFTTQYGLQ